MNTHSHTYPALFQAAPDGYAMPLTVMLEMFQQPISFYPWAARIGGSAMAGLWLCYAMRCTQSLLDERGGSNPDALWFEAPVEEIQEQTGMTRFEQQSAKRCLMQTGFLESRHVGLPAKKMYRLDLPKLMRELERGALQGVGV